MHYKFLSDSHIHSDNSLKANDPTIKLCEQASKIGLYAITIVDSCDCDKYSSRASRKTIQQTTFQIKKAQDIFHDYVNVLSGIELKQATHNKSVAEYALSLSNFDFVLASIDKLKNAKNFSKIHFTNETVNYILDRYFEEIINLIEWGNFDSLSYITYPFEFILGRSKLVLDINNINEKLKIILEKLAQKEKALEISSQMLNNSKIDLINTYNILSIFKKAGGKYITFGSNSKSCKDIGIGLKTGFEVAYDVGFSHFCLFKNRAPHLLLIN